MLLHEYVLMLIKKKEREKWCIFMRAMVQSRFTFNSTFYTFTMKCKRNENATRREVKWEG